MSVEHASWSSGQNLMPKHARTGTFSSSCPFGWCGGARTRSGSSEELARTATRTFSRTRVSCGRASRWSCASRCRGSPGELAAVAWERGQRVCSVMSSCELTWTRPLRCMYRLAERKALNMTVYWTTLPWLPGLVAIVVNCWVLATTCERFPRLHRSRRVRSGSAAADQAHK